MEKSRAADGNYATIAERKKFLIDNLIANKTELFCKTYMICINQM